jgi:hypothetical protein
MQAVLPAGPNRDLRFVEAALGEAREVCVQFESRGITQKVVGVGRVYLYKLTSSLRHLGSLASAFSWEDKGMHLLVLSVRDDDHLELLVTQSITHGPKSYDVVEGRRKEGQVGAGEDEAAVELCIPVTSDLQFKRVTAEPGLLQGVLDESTDFVYTLVMRGGASGGTDLRLAIDFDSVEDMPCEVFEFLIWLVQRKNGMLRDDTQISSPDNIGVDVYNADEVRRRMALAVGSFAARPVDEATALAGLNLSSG